MAHAYLFVGPRGVGKTSVARILAFEANKAKYSDDGHIDIIEIDAASNRRIDEIRELRDKIHIAPTELYYKVYIIDEVHMLTREAFNALLKTLEEPPEHAIFILATTEAHKVPDTITSRAQTFVFRPITEPDIAAHLAKIAKKEKISAEKAALHMIAEFSNGSFRDSISLLDQLATQGKKIDEKLVADFLGYGSKDQINRLLSAVGNGDTKAVSERLTKLLQDGAQPQAIANQLIELLRLEEATTQSLSLVDALLKVSSSSQPHIKLETELLRAAVSAKPDNISPQAVNQPQAAKPKADKISTSSSSKTQSSKLQGLEELDEAEWSKILLSVKQENYSVYAVLRMAFVEINDEVMRLTFPFKFHARRFEDPKYLALVRGGANDIKLKISSIVVEVDEHSKPTSGEIAEGLISEKEVSDKPMKDSKVSSVLDTFGGGEVVEL